MDTSRKEGAERVERQGDVAVCAHDAGTEVRAYEIAKRYHFPLQRCTENGGMWTLCVTREGLVLGSIGDSGTKPLRVEFRDPAFRTRLKRLSQNGELLLKAVGLKPGQSLSVLDVTAGLGMDGFLLAKGSAQVKLVERSPVISALLEDGLNRALQHPEDALLSIQLVQSDARDYLRRLALEEYPDVITLDPMFPDRQKSALNKKSMRWIKSLVGDDDDAPEVLALALKVAKKRVVVKRPRLAPPLAGPKPTRALIGKSSRFDIYEIV